MFILGIEANNSYHCGANCLSLSLINECYNHYKYLIYFFCVCVLSYEIVLHN